MLVEKSPLCLLDTSLLKFDFEYIPVNEGSNELLPSDFFAHYKVDIDFNHVVRQNQITVIIGAKINQDGDKPGYQLNAECGCIFEFAKDNQLDTKQRKSLSGYSTIYIALNALRGYISSITANGPMGKYTLPSIDLNKLIEAKLAKRRKENEDKITVAEEETVKYTSTKTEKPSLKSRVKK
jgi:preprotein translocase subunit SecB